MKGRAQQERQFMWEPEETIDDEQWHASLRRLEECVSKWTERVTAFAAECRQERPLPTFSDLHTRLEQQQYMVIHGQLQQQFNWLRDDMKRLVVFTSDAPGLVAMQQVITPLPERLVLLYGDEYERFSKRYEEEMMESCLSHFWNYFRPIGENLYEQHEGQISGPLSGSGSRSYWRWDGDQLIFDREGMSFVA
jgi:hypothetical protein